jgi:spore coat protein CotF
MFLKIFKFLVLGHLYPKCQDLSLKNDQVCVQKCKFQLVQFFFFNNNFKAKLQNMNMFLQNGNSGLYKIFLKIFSANLVISIFGV